MSIWEVIQQAKTLDGYNDAVRAFREGSEPYDGLFDYVNEQWLSKCQRWVQFWTSQYYTRGMIASSRVEGAHAAIKKRLRSCKSDLEKVVSELTIICLDQFQESMSLRKIQRNKMPTHM